MLTAEISLLVENNLNLVRSIVSRYVKGSLDDSDLYSVGCMGLLNAAMTYDPSKSKFSTWATKVVTSRIISELRKMKVRTSVVLSSLDDIQKEECLQYHKTEELPCHLLDELTRDDNSDTKSESEGKKLLKQVFIQERSFSEIGRDLGLTREAVRKRAQKAIEQIRQKKIELIREYMA